MDVISFSEAATANSRIEKNNANPDSTSGIITVPKVIESTETITIPAGRVAVLPNLVIDGVLNIENGGEVFIPSGSTFSDLDKRIDTLDSTTVKLTGNSATATKLQTARTINGVSFDGGSNISVGLDNQSGAILTPFTLDNTHKNKLLVCENGITITLPTINTIKSGDLFYITNGGLEPLTLALNGNSTNLNTLKVTGGETLVIQSDGGSHYRCISRKSTPVYDFDTNLTQQLEYNTVFRANTDLTLVVICAGSFLNGVEIVIGTTTSPTRVVGRAGDDINSNTKYATLTAVIPAGLYFKVQTFGAWSFEGIEITVYKHK